MSERITRGDTLTLQERSCLTVDAVRWFFDTGKIGGDEVQRLKKNMTADRVAQFYRYIADLWPARLNAVDMLRGLRSTELLEGFYVGWPRPETILRSVTRASLYSERIFVELPFHLPWLMNDEFDPVQYPGQMRTDTHRWATMMLLLEPWIRSGLVTIIPATDAFDSDLRRAFWAAGKRRFDDGLISILEEDEAQIIAVSKAEHERAYYSLSDDILIAKLKEEGLTDDGVPAMLAYIHKQRDDDPFFIEGVLQTDGYLQTLSIPTLESTIHTCGLTGAFPFTDIRGKWDELMSAVGDLPSDAAVWTPLSAAFAQLKFDFLDGYDARFAYQVREEGRLVRFRQYLRDIWKTIDGSPSIEASERHARDLTERLAVEYQTAQTEWALLQKKYNSKTKKDALSYGFLGASGAATAPSLSQGMLAVALSLGVYLFRAKEDAGMLSAEVANFRTNFPLALLIDIKEQTS